MTNTVFSNFATAKVSLLEERVQNIVISVLHKMVETTSRLAKRTPDLKTQSELQRAISFIQDQILKPIEATRCELTDKSSESAKHSSFIGLGL